MLMATLREGRPAPAPSRVMVASAKPFIPNVADGPGPPLPSGLGRPSPRIAAEPASDVISSNGPKPSRARAASAATAPEAAKDASADASPSPSPPSAGFAPSETGALGLMSGRGLY
jgi:rare lipoprotein A